MMKRKLIYLSLFVLLSFLFDSDLSYAAELSIKEGRKVVKVDSTKAHHYRSMNNFQEFDIDYKGKIRLSEDDQNVTSISPGGYLKVRKTTFGNTRSLYIESDLSGRLSYNYKENRHEQPFEPDGKQWLAEILPDVVRRTSIGAEQRVDRFYRQDGVKGVLSEIDRLESNSARAYYFDLLLAKPSLKQDDLAKIATEIGRSISSNSKRAELLRKHQDLFLKKNGETVTAYFRALASLSSNSEKGATLRELLQRKDLSDQVLEESLQVCMSMSSNSEKGAVLRQVNRQFPQSESARQAYFRAVRSMSSNSEKGYVIRDLFQRAHLSQDDKVEALHCVRSMSSNHEKGAVLISLIGNGQLNETVLEAYYDVLKSMSSNHEKGRVMRELLSEQALTPATISRLLDVTRSMSSNSERANVLEEIIPFLPGNEVAEDEFFQALCALSSNSEKARVMESLIETNGFKVKNKRLFFDCLQEMSSNSSKGSVLRRLARVVDKFDAETLEGYLKTVEYMSSSTEKRASLSYLVQKSEFKSADYISVLKAVQGISSNTEKASVLMDISKKMPKDDQVENAYRDAAATLSSDYEYRRVIEALN